MARLKLILVEINSFFGIIKHTLQTCFLTPDHLAAVLCHARCMEPYFYGCLGALP